MTSAVRSRCYLLILILLVAAAVPASAQLFSKKVAEPAPSPASSGMDAERGGPELLGDANNPVLRYPVAHQHAMSACNGYLTISRDRMKFESKTEPT